MAEQQALAAAVQAPLGQLDVPFLNQARADLLRRNKTVIDGRVTELAHQGGRIASVNLASGEKVAVDILFANPRKRPSASLPGLYSAGDLANPGMPSVTMAIWQGATAGISTQQSLLV